MNRLTDDALAVMVGKGPFTYSSFLILIVLVVWMELGDYQGMDVDAVKVCKGAQNQNLWYVKEAERMKYRPFLFWIYREVL